jgi:hypothetical protein
MANDGISARIRELKTAVAERVVEAAESGTGAPPTAGHSGQREYGRHPGTTERRPGPGCGREAGGR